MVLKNSSTKSSLANLGSLTPADLAIKFDGVVVSCNAKTKRGIGVAVLAVFGLKIKDLVGKAFSFSGDATVAKDNWANDCSNAIPYYVVCELNN